MSKHVCIIFTLLVLLLTLPAAAYDLHVGLASGQIQQVSFDGTSYTLGGSVSGTAKYMAVDSNGTLYVQFSNSMHRFTYSGGTYTDTGSVSMTGRGLAIGPTGEIYTLTSSPDWISKYTWNGSSFVLNYFTGLLASAVSVDRITGEIYTAGTGPTWVMRWVDTGSALSWTHQNGLGGAKNTALDDDGDFWTVGSTEQAVYNWDGDNMVNMGGTGLNNGLDIASRGDGYMFITQDGAQLWLSAWRDIDANPVIVDAVSLGAAYLAVDPDPNGVIHTISSDGILRAWNYDETQVWGAGFSIIAQITLGSAGTDIVINLPPDQNTYTLTIAADPAYIDTVSPAPGVYTLAEGTIVQLSAGAYNDCPNNNEVRVFDHWVGDVANPFSPTTTITMNANKTVTAYYVDGRVCGDVCHPYPLRDFNQDCIVDLADLETFASGWLDSSRPQDD